MFQSLKMEDISKISKSTVKCDLCGKTFGSKINLSEHISKHKCNKSYSCSDCNKAFATISALKDHLKNHVVDKPFSCDVCYKNFSKQTYLSMHIKNHEQAKTNLSDIESTDSSGATKDSRATLYNTDEEITDNIEHLTDDDALALAVDFIL